MGENKLLNTINYTFDDNVLVGELNGLFDIMSEQEGNRFSAADIFHYSLRDDKKEAVAVKYGINVTARFDNQLVGYLRIISDRSYIHYIVDVMINPEYQGHRIGSKMVELALEKLKEEGFIKVLLTALPGKEDFYKRMGFKETMSPVLALRGEDYPIEG